MDYRLLLMGLLTISINVYAQGIPAHRDEGVSFKAYVHTLLDSREQKKSAYDLAVPLAQLNSADIPKWSSIEDVRSAFQLVRDVRFLSHTSRRTFLRRESWLYPDDGCFARAALAIKNMAMWEFPSAKKLFAFGDLSVKTPNSPSGTVSWWYHVVPVVSVDGKSFVIDPALDMNAPLTIEDWVDRMGGAGAEIKLAVCSSGAYTPMDDCRNPKVGADSSAVSAQVYYLSEEWDRLVELKRNPENELGNLPPWTPPPKN